MGKRVEGRKKQKSIKANVTSKFSSKRKLSRMGKKVQAGKAGPNTEFITRSAALRKLQITLKDFRRLCILKGIYPRVPAKGLKGNDKVYYDIKDISYIMHEPLLQKFREFKGFMKKIRRAAGRNQFEEARRKNDLKPKYSLDHLVKERYPRFIDALRDLDDALCMIHLFAALPSVGRITTEHTATCQRLAREWQYYLAKSKSLKKAFISVKGVYFQAEILGEPITWLVPHAFTQSLPKEVDFRVMLTFLEFYEVFVRFVLFKLYFLKTWQYPPAINQDLEAEGCCLLAMKSDEIATSASAGDEQKKEGESQAMKKVNKKDLKKIKAIDISSLLKKNKGETAEEEGDDDGEEEEEEEEEEEDISAPLASVFSDLQTFHTSSSSSSNKKSKTVEGSTAAVGVVGGEEEEEDRVFHQQSSSTEAAAAPRLLFQNLVFFVNREVPLDWCQLIVTAFGGKIGWEHSSLSPISAEDPRITHQIVDRPLPANARERGLQREFVQPQWLFDCINAQLLLPSRLYRPGEKLPPHLSPFVNDEKEGYLPKYREEIQQLQREQSQPAEEEGDEEDEEEEEDQVEELDEIDDFQAKPSSQKNQNKKNQKQSPSQPEEEEEDDDNNNDNDDNDDNDDDDSDNDNDDSEEEEEEAAVVTSSNKKKGPKAIVYQRKEAPVDEATETKELSKQMMKKKTKRLYDRMQYGIEKKKEQVQSLLNKRKAIDEASSSDSNSNHNNKKKSSSSSNSEKEQTSNKKQKKSQEPQEEDHDQNKKKQQGKGRNQTQNQKKQ